MTFSDGAASRRTVLRGLTSAASVLALGGCTSLASTGTRYDASEISADPTLMVATNRKAVDGARAKPWFGAERASALSIMHAKLTPPGDGRFALASVGLDDWRLDAIEPVPQIGDLPGPSAAARDVLIYVHGFNQTFETAVLDAKAGCLYPNNARALIEAKARGFDNCLLCDMLGNIASGIALEFESDIRVGDFIKVGDAARRAAAELLGGRA